MGKEISKKIITLVLTLAFSCGMVILIAVPLYRDLKITELKIETERENKTAREEFLSKIIKFRKMNNKVREDDLKKIDRIILNRNSYEDYLSRVVYLAQINKVTVKNFFVSQQPSAPVKIKMRESEGAFLRKSPQLRETEVSFSALGDFSDFMNFIDDFEKMGPLADEESLKITTMRNKKDKERSGEEGKEENEENQKQEEELVLNYEVGFKFYY